jgi:hypothetical protein
MIPVRVTNRCFWRLVYRSSGFLTDGPIGAKGGCAPEYTATTTRGKHDLKALDNKEVTTLPHPPCLQISSIAKRPDFLPTSSLCFGLSSTQNLSTIAKYLSVIASLMPSVRKSSSGKRVVRRQKVLHVVEESQGE